MDALAHLMGVAAALVLVMAAFVCLFNAGYAWQLVKQLMLILVAFWLVPFVVLGLVTESSPAGLAIGLALLSIGAYFWYQLRLRHPDRQPRARGSERTPILPRGDD